MTPAAAPIGRSPRAGQLAVVHPPVRRWRSRWRRTPLLRRSRNGSATLLAPYLATLNFDLNPNAYPTGRFYLTHDRRDRRRRHRSTSMPSCPTEPSDRSTIPEPGLWPPERRRHYQALANAAEHAGRKRRLCRPPCPGPSPARFCAPGERPPETSASSGICRCNGRGSARAIPAAAILSARRIQHRLRSPRVGLAQRPGRSGQKGGRRRDGSRRQKAGGQKTGDEKAASGTAGRRYVGRAASGGAIEMAVRRRQLFAQLRPPAWPTAGTASGSRPAIPIRSA